MSEVERINRAAAEIRKRWAAEEVAAAEAECQRRRAAEPAEAALRRAAAEIRELCKRFALWAAAAGVEQETMLAEDWSVKRNAPKRHPYPG